MSFLRYASFTVLASAIADATGSLPAEVLRIGNPDSPLLKSAHRHEFAYEPTPGYLYVRSRAISSRTNDNFDTFPAHSIKEAWRTFIGKPVFVNHHNDNHKRCRGVIIDAALHEDTTPDGGPDTWVEVLMEIDAARFPMLAKAVVRGEIDRTSMGTEVALSTCSYCGNTAANPAEYCRHIPAMKGQRITRTTASGSKESVLISEICEGLSFFENSLLVEAPADPTAVIWGVDSRGMASDPTTARMAKAATKTAAEGDDAQYGKIQEANLGLCYELAGKRVAFGPDGTMFSGYKGASLIHGTITGFGEQPLGHAWVEEPNGDRWEPATDTTYSASAFERLFHPVVHDRYDMMQARQMMSRQKHFGPWTAALATRHEGSLTEFEVIEAEAILAAVENRRMRDSMPKVSANRNTTSRKTGLGEQTAPAEVDTLRVEACPVCGDADSFNGTKCNVCGFIKPPDLFDDPDLERAKQVDLRGGDASGEADPEQPSSELECDSCGSTFPLAQKPKVGTTSAPVNGSGGMSSTSAVPGVVPKPKPTAPKKPNPFAKDKQKDQQNPNQQDPDQQEQPDQDEQDPAELQDEAQQPEPDQEQPDPAAEQPLPAGDPATDQPLAAGDTCPTCEQGTLNEIPVETDPQAVPSSGGQNGDFGAQQVDPNLDPNADHDDQNPDPGIGKRDPNQPTDPKDEAALPDQSKVPDPNAAPEEDEEDDPEDDPEDDSKEDKDSDGKKKSLPPWMKKKTSYRAWSSRRREVDAMANPAQNNRNRLISALRTQQSQISAQAEENLVLKRAMLTLASAAGVERHPHFVALMKSAGGPADQAALAPAAKDDPESIGATPSSANTGVTPSGTTDVSNLNVSLPAAPFNGLIDVTAPPSAAVEVPKGDAAHVDTDVKVGQPSNEPFPNNSGWKGASIEDPQVRLMASLRLARMRKAAGVGGDVEEMSLGQAISENKNLSLAIITHEISTLAAVAAAKAPAPRTAAARSLVPQRAVEVARTVPSLTTSASAGSQPTSGSGDALADSLF